MWETGSWNWAQFMLLIYQVLWICWIRWIHWISATFRNNSSDIPLKDFFTTLYALACLVILPVYDNLTLLPPQCSLSVHNCPVSGSKATSLTICHPLPDIPDFTHSLRPDSWYNIKSLSTNRSINNRHCTVMVHSHVRFIRYVLLRELLRELFTI